MMILGPQPSYADRISGDSAAPALGERRHRSLACRLIAVRGALDAVGTVAARPHPGTALRPGRTSMSKLVYACAESLGGLRLGVEGAHQG